MRLALLAVLLVVSIGAWAQPGPTFAFAGGPFEPLTVLGTDANETIYGWDWGGFVASSDGGRTWTLRAASFYPNRLAVASDGSLWATSPSGIHTSSDGGVTWSLARSGAVADIATDGTDVYAVTGSDIRRLRDGAWTTLPRGGWTDGVTNLSQIAVAGGMLVVGARYSPASYSSWTRLFRTQDDGATWRTSGMDGHVTEMAAAPDGSVWVASGPGVFLYNPSVGGLAQVRPDTTLRVAAGDVSSVSLASDGRVLYSVGTTVRAVGSPGALLDTGGSDAGRAVVLADGTVVASTVWAYSGGSPDPPSSARSSSGAYRRAGGEVRHAGRRGGVIYTLGTDTDGALLAGGWVGTVFRQTADGIGWRATPATLGVVRRLLSDNEGLLAIGASVWTEEGAAPWAVPSAVRLDGQDAYPYSGLGEVSDVLTVGTRTLVAAPVAGFYDPGDQFGLRVYESLAYVATLIVGDDVRSVRAAGDAIYALAWGPTHAITNRRADHRIYRSTDDGATWAPNDTGVTAAHVYDVTLAPDGTTHAGTSDGIWRRSDEGVWERVALDGLPVRTFAVVGGDLVAGALGGLHRYVDGEWAPWGSGLHPASQIWAVQLYESDGEPHLAVASGVGVYTTDLRAIAGEAVPAPGVEVRVFPNPTAVRLTIEHRPGADAEVLDVFGRRVARVTLGADGRATIDVSSLAAGAYLVRVAGGGTTHVTVVR